MIYSSPRWRELALEMRILAYWWCGRNLMRSSYVKEEHNWDPEQIQHDDCEYLATLMVLLVDLDRQLRGYLMYLDRHQHGYLHISKELCSVAMWKLVGTRSDRPMDLPMDNSREGAGCSIGEGAGCSAAKGAGRSSTEGDVMSMITIPDKY